MKYGVRKIPSPLREIQNKIQGAVLLFFPWLSSSSIPDIVLGCVFDSV